MLSIIMGTAGHIDHGKTSLIKALTGVDLDRLEEEKRRGITIELGFVSLDIGGGERIGVVDVPGHEKFVKTMVAGAQGIDMVMLVVAADEGVMPQTIEHLEICRLLGVRTGLVALTKSDKVDEETRLMASEDVRELVKNTFLEDAPIVPCSAATGEGLDELRKTIAQVAHSLPPRSESGIFRMPIDRRFSVKGYGTVVTGTVIAGAVKKGEAVEIAPGGKKTVARELEAHGEKVEKARAGQRLAINLPGIEVGEVGRGLWLVKPGTIRLTRTVDVKIGFSKGASVTISHGQRVLAHVGTARTLADVDLLGQSEGGQGDSIVTRLRLDTPLPLVAGDHFVLRGFARGTTVAGGVVLDPLPGERIEHRGLRKRESPEFLGALDSSAIGDRAQVLIAASGAIGVMTKHLLQRLPFDPPEVMDALGKLTKARGIVRIAVKEELFISGGSFDQVRNDIVEQLRASHKERPMGSGTSRAELRSKRMRKLPEPVYAAALASLIEEGKIVSDGDLIRLREHAAKATGADEKDIAAIEKALLDSGNTPPTVAELGESLKRDKKDMTRLLKFMLDKGRAAKISEELYYHPQTIDSIRGLLEQFLLKNNEIGPVQFKELTGASRKFAIALLEYFDRERVTLRIGDKRVLRKEAAGGKADRGR